jgi:N-acetylglucosamine-6-phosphate deacetylase
MNPSERIILSGANILLEDKWVNDYALVIEDRKIKAIIPSDMIAHHLPAKQYTFSAEDSIVPGFIDLHVHGAAGADVMDADIEALNTMSLALAKEGVTGFLATTMTAASDHIEKVLAVIPQVKNNVKGAALLGVHLEGPFIAKEKMGAQRGDAVISPDISLIKQWQQLSDKQIKLVTLAPELSGATEFIETLCKMDIVASIGHTNATFAETEQAIAAGASYATHLFNAMRGLHQREPGAVGAILLSNAVTAELIADGHHLHPAIIDLVLRLKDKNHLVLITDAMRAKCMCDGQYDLGGQQVTVDKGKATLSDGTLAGSVLTLSSAIQYMCDEVKISLADAVRMASYNPARVLGLNESKGSINVNKDADIVVLNAAYEPLLTICQGEVVFE